MCFLTKTFPKLHHWVWYGNHFKSNWSIPYHRPAVLFNIATLKNTIIMNRILIAIIVLLVIIQPSFAQKKIFNGKDLTGWKVYGTEKWYVEKGELVCESGPDKQYGYFGTEKKFKDFELTLEFKQESNGNS